MSERDMMIALERVYDAALSDNLGIVQGFRVVDGKRVPAYFLCIKSDPDDDDKVAVVPFAQLLETNDIPSVLDYTGEPFVVVN